MYPPGLAHFESTILILYLSNSFALSRCAIRRVVLLCYLAIRFEFGYSGKLGRLSANEIMTDCPKKTTASLYLQRFKSNDQRWDSRVVISLGFDAEGI